MNRQRIIIKIAALCILGGVLILFMAAVIGGKLEMENLIDFNKNLKLANTVEVSADQINQINQIEISYLSDSITFYQGDSENLVLEEYMNRWDETMLATVTTKDGVISIKCGDRNVINFMGGLRTIIKVYLPKSYNGSLDVSVSSGSLRSEQLFTLDHVKLESASGSIRMKGFTAENGITGTNSSGSLDIETIETPGVCTLSANSGSIRSNSIQASELTVSTSSGSITLDKVTADTITGEAHSGSIKLEDGTGTMQLSTTSGSIRVDGSGHGRFDSSSGSVKVNLKTVDGDIRMKTTSGSLKLALPKSLGFMLKVNTSSGSIHTDFDDQLSFNKKGNSAEGQIGAAGGPAIDLSASSGSVRVTQ